MGLEKYDELARLVAEARTHYEEFSGGKKVAATRCRQALQNLKRAAQEARIEIQSLRKGPESKEPPKEPPKASS